MGFLSDSFSARSRSISAFNSCSVATGLLIPQLAGASRPPLRNLVGNANQECTTGLGKSAIFDRKASCHEYRRQTWIIGSSNEWLDDMRNATEDTLLGLADHLPSEAAEALLDLATGVTPQPAKPVGRGMRGRKHQQTFREGTRPSFPFVAPRVPPAEATLPRLSPSQALFVSCDACLSISIGKLPGRSPVTSLLTFGALRSACGRRLRLRAIVRGVGRQSGR